MRIARCLCLIALLGCGREPPPAPPKPVAPPPALPAPVESSEPAIEAPLAAPAAPSPGDEALARATALNDQAVSRFQQGDEEGALDLLRQALRLAPDEQALRHNAARCLIARGDRLARTRRFEEAARDYHEAAGITPEDPLPTLREAQALHEALRDRDVVALLMDGVRRFPRDARAHELLARSLYRLGENARAIESWEEALRLDPSLEAARAALERAKREEAVEGELITDLGARHFTIKYDGARDAALGRLVAGTLEQAYVEVGQLLQRYPAAEVAVVLYPGRSFQETTGSHAWVAALYDGKIRVPVGGLERAPASEVRRVLAHEYAHALLRAVGGPRLPVWLQEGFAQVAEGRTAADARKDLRQEAVPPLAALERSFTSESNPDRVRQLYAAACAFVHSLLAQGGGPRLAELLDALGRGQSVDDALRATYQREASELYADWVATLPR